MPFCTIKHFFAQLNYLLIAGTLGTIASYLVGKAAGEVMDAGSLGKAMKLYEQRATVALWLTNTTAAI